MDKVKRFFINLSLCKTIILYITVFALIAGILSVMTMFLCEKVSKNIYDSYPQNGEKYYLTDKSGNQLGGGVIIGKESIRVSDSDERRLTIVNIISNVSFPVYCIIFLIIAVLLFYRNKLKEPLLKLERAHDKISNNDLDFSIEYISNDEMGKLCASFEKMRATLLQNNKKMWHQMEERKRLNAAFAHDLRTPLTVLKGYSEILQYSDESVSQKDTALMMMKHIDRLERYVDSMSTLQRIEDIVPNYQKICVPDFLLSMKQAASLICEKAEKCFCFQNNTTTKTVMIDTEMFSQVVLNLVSNSSHYATSKVELEVTELDEVIYIKVCDDGMGFSHESLKKGTEPYYTEDIDKSNHFGLGLYICKLLCHHHGGNIEIGNTEFGGQVIASFKVSNY